MCAPFDIKHFPLLLKGWLYFPSKLWLQKQLSRHHKKGPEVTAGLPKKNIYISLRLYHTVLYQTVHIEHQHPPADVAQIRLLALPWVLDGVFMNPSTTPASSYGHRSPSRLSNAGGRYLRSHQRHSGQQKLIASGVCFQWKHVNSGLAAV